MADYNVLKAAIADYVKDRTGLSTIDGDGLQETLMAMVNSLGANYQFAGVAKLTPTQTDPGTPDQNVFYIATEPGTYTNFPISGGYLQVAENEVAIFKYNGQWSKETTGAATADVVNQLGQKVDEIPIVGVSQNTLMINGMNKGKVPTDIIDGLNSTDATSALSANQGRVMKGRIDEQDQEISDIRQEVSDLSLGKFYGFFVTSGDLPDGDLPGYAYVGESSPFAIYMFVDGAWSDSGAVYTTPAWNGKIIPCSVLGMIANDYDSHNTNTEILANAINSGYIILCDDKYYISSTTSISKDINIVGNGEFVVCGTWSINQANVTKISLDGVTLRSLIMDMNEDFDNAVTTFISFPEAYANDYSLDRIILNNVIVDNVVVVRFVNRGSHADHVGKISVCSCTFKNLVYEGVGAANIAVDDLVILDNKVYKFKNTVFRFSTITDKKVDHAIIRNNYISNKGYVTPNPDLYTCFVLLECNDASYIGNVMEDVIWYNSDSSADSNLYDIYCNCEAFKYCDNVKHNVIHTKKDIPLCKAKGFLKEGGSRVITNNSMIIDDDLVDYIHTQFGIDVKAIENHCYFTIFAPDTSDTLVQSILIIENNTINIPSCLFTYGTERIWGCKEEIIRNNNVVCYSIYQASGTYANSNTWIRNSYANAHCVIENNRVRAATFLSPTTTIAKTLGANAELIIRGGQPGAFLFAGSGISGKIVCEDVTFTQGNNSVASAHIYGVLKNCVLDYCKGLNTNAALYLTANVSIVGLSFKNTPTNKQLYIRNILTNLGTYAILTITYNDNSQKIFIDNSAKKLYINDVEYDSTQSQTINLPVKTNAAILLNNNDDRIIFNGNLFADGVSIDLAVLDNATFNAQLYKDAGPSNKRPSAANIRTKGYSYFDEDLNKPLWWNGTSYVDATGTAV